MKPIKLANVVVDHCPDCGTTFFDENEINRINLTEARYLSSVKKTETISGDQKFCPRDHTSLYSYRQESIPLHITLLHCWQCGGIVCFPDDLIEFKKAQKAKLDYFKTWRLPTPRIRSLIVYGVTLLMISFATLAVRIVSTPQTTRISAEELITNSEIITSGNIRFICFSTKTDAKSTIVFKNIRTGEEISREISPQSTRSHCSSVSTDEIPVSDYIYYRLIVITTNTVVQTDLAPFK